MPKAREVIKPEELYEKFINKVDKQLEEGRIYWVQYQSTSQWSLAKYENGSMVLIKNNSMLNLTEIHMICIEPIDKAPSE